MESDQEFVEYIIKALVDNPADVRTDRTVDEMGVLITLHINPADMGQVIGRMGQTAKAVRTLLRVVGAKHKARVNLKIDEPEGSHRGPRREREDRGDRGSNYGGGQSSDQGTNNGADNSASNSDSEAAPDNSANEASAPDMDDFKL